MKLNTIIVEDSELALLSLSQWVKNHPRLELVGACNTASESKKLLKNQQIDLILLDIELPEVSGFELLDTLVNPPQIIIVSGFEQYALRAFDYGVTDFLTKPINQNRFLDAITKAVKIYQNTNSPIAKGDYITIKSNQVKKQIALNSIQWVEALGDYVKVVTNQSNEIVLSTLSDFGKKLPEDKFLRIHKSFIVNLERVDAFNASSLEINEKELPISRQRKNALEKALNQYSKNRIFKGL